MIELITVIILAGVLAVTALPRFFDQDSFENRGFYTEVLNATRYAQQLAVAINCTTQINLTNTGYTVTLDDDSAACDGASVTKAAPDPTTGQLGFTGSSTSVTISPANIQFTALGKANADVTITAGGYQFTVHASTGYIEEL